MLKLGVILLCGVLAFMPFVVHQEDFLPVETVRLVQLAEEDHVIRIGGSNRYTTAVEVSQTGWPGGTDTVLLARGDNFPDSLAGVSLAYQLNAPILLTPSTSLHDATKQEIERLGASRVIILGGTGAISAGVETELLAMGTVDTVDRLGGANRYETAKLIAGELDKGASFDTAFIAFGLGFPDALAAASYGAKDGYPILLTGKDSLPQATKDALDNLSSINNIVIVGGEAVISSAVEAELIGRGLNVQRIMGANRYETAVELAREYLPMETKEVFIATGLKFPDALAGGVLAAKRGTGVLLVRGNRSTLPDSLESFLVERGITRATILGGTGAVTEEIEERLLALLEYGEIILYTNTVSEDGANNTVIGELSLIGATYEAVQFVLLDSAGDRFKVIGNQLMVADCTKIRYALDTFHEITVEASDGSRSWVTQLIIQVTESQDFVIQSTANRDPLSGRPGIASDGTDFVVAWIEGDTVKCARVSEEGIVLDPGGIVLGVSSGYPAYPSVAFDGTNYLIVWVWADDEIYGVRLTPDGDLLDETPIKITLGANSKQRVPSVVFGGTNYYIVWRTNSDEIKGARVLPSGEIMDDQAGVKLGTGFYPWVAFDGTNYLIVWHRWGNGLDIYGNRVSAADGSVLDGTGFAISNATYRQDHSSVAFDGTNYLVVWHDTREGGVDSWNTGRVYGARVTPTGQVLDTEGIMISEICREGPPVVVFDGSNYFVVWQADYTEFEHSRLVDIFGQKVSPQGELIGEPVPITTAHGHQFGPQMGQSDTQFFIAWSEGGPFERDQGVWGRLLPK